MSARNRVQYPPPPPISSCEGPRIIQKLKDVVVQILELPLYISILFVSDRGGGGGRILLWKLQREGMSYRQYNLSCELLATLWCIAFVLIHTPSLILAVGVAL